MKKFFLYLVMVIFFINGYSQQTDYSELENSKAVTGKNNEKEFSGWVLFGLGTVGFLVGGINELSNFNINIFDPNAYKPKPQLTALYVASGIAVASGLAIVLISKSKQKNNKKNETSLLLKMENTIQLLRGSVSKENYPALALRIKL